MEIAAHTLRTDPIELHPEVVRLQGRLAETERVLTETEQFLAERDQRIEQLLDYIALLKRQRFGPSSERVSPDQLGLFDEAELEALIGDLEQEVVAPPPPPTPETPAQPAKAKPVRKPLPEHLPRIERVIDLAPEDKQALGEDWTLIGYDSAEQLAIIPRQPYVIVTLRAKYAPRHPEATGGEEGVVIAPRAPQILPKAIAHSSLLADIVVAKYADALPLYRQERIFARDGLDIPRQTMAGWILGLNEPLKPLMAAMKALLYTGAVLHIDETRVQVLCEPGRKATQQSYMWVYCGGPPGRAVILFDYAETRGGSAPRAFLGGPTEPGADPPLGHLYLLTDAYSVYSPLALELGVLDHAACWAHVRRKFVEAAAGRSQSAAAHQMVGLIGKLYAVERGLKDAAPEERKRERDLHSRPILDAIKAWLDEKAPKAAPKGLLGKAIAYALNLWPQLITFLQDGHIPIDNNLAENAIRPFALGRKNWMFSASPAGAKASATLYSLIESAKANALEPRAYLGFLFERLPLAKTPADIAALLPQNLCPEDIRPAPVNLPSPTTDPAAPSSPRQA
jgi:transposase